MSHNNKCQNCLRIVNISDNFCSACGTKILKTENCPICLEDKIIEVTPCGHKICLDCISNLKKHNKCHICRASLIGWKDNLIQHQSNTSLGITNFNNNSNQSYNIYNTNSSYAINHIERTVKICPKCNSQNIECHQIDGKYCKNCKQYLSDFKIVRESEIGNYPEINKEIVNPTIKNVCPYCLSDNIKMTGPQWDLIRICNNCSRDIKTIKKINLRDWESIRFRG